MQSDTLREAMSSVTTYASSFVAGGVSVLHDIEWMSVGAALLLLARLIQDVPPAYRKICSWFSKKKKVSKRRKQ